MIFEESENSPWPWCDWLDLVSPGGGGELLPGGVGGGVVGGGGREQGRGREVLKIRISKER